MTPADAQQLFNDWMQCEISLYWERPCGYTLQELLERGKDRAARLGLDWPEIFEAELLNQIEMNTD